MTIEYLKKATKTPATGEDETLRIVTGMLDEIETGGCMPPQPTLLAPQSNNVALPAIRTSRSVSVRTARSIDVLNTS